MSIHFILPGYAPTPVGGYRVVYDYAIEIQRRTGERVYVHHSPWPVLRRAAELSRADVRGLFSRAAKAVLDRPRSKGVRWYTQTAEISGRFTFFGPYLRLRKGDIVVATAAQTAPLAAKIARRSAGAYFIQHVETWSATSDFVDATWRLPLHRIVIAPWLKEYGDALGVDSHLVLNAIDGAQFRKGPPLSQRRMQVIAMLSPQPFKRADVLVAVYEKIHAADGDVSLVAFGTESRPSHLPDYVDYVHRPSRAELATLYAESRVYLCTSDAEGWHLPPGEALLCGTPVVSTDIGGVRVVAGDEGVYADTADVNGLAESVLALLADTARAQALADSGSARLRAYTPEQAASAFLDQLNRARAGRV